MAAYTSIAAWQAAQAVSGPVNLLDVDCTALASADWIASPPSALGALTVTPSYTGSPSAWGPDGSTGIVLAGSGAMTGTLRIDWASVSSMMVRALTDMDQLIFEIQCNATLGAATVDTTRAAIDVSVTANNNNGWAAIQRSNGGTKKRQVSHYPSGDALLDAATDMRCVALRCTETSVWGNVVTGVLGAAPTPTKTYYVTSTTSQVLATAGAWSLEGTNSFLRIILQRGASETVATKIERVRLWLLPGTEYA